MAKGSQFERNVCSELSRWWSGGMGDDLFWRTSQSGGRATTRRKKGKSTRAHSGDICALDEEGAPLTKLITFELKRGYNRATIHDLLDRLDRAKAQTFDAWIQQAKTAAKNAGTKFWAIIHKRDRREEMIYFPLSLMKEFSKQAYGQLPEINVKVATLTKDNKPIKIVGMKMSTFLETVEPVEIRSILKKVQNAEGRRK